MTVPIWRKRLALVVLVCFVLYLAFIARKGEKTPAVIHANRYSKNHKFRPAASPIITETLKDGRIRIHGAHPGTTPSPTPTPSKIQGQGKRKRQSVSGKVSAKAERNGVGSVGTGKRRGNERRQ